MTSPLDRALRRLGERPDAIRPTTKEARRFVAEVSMAPLMIERHARKFELSFEEFDVLVGHFRAFINAWPKDPQDEIARGRQVLPPGDRD